MFNLSEPLNPTTFQKCRLRFINVSEHYLNERGETICLDNSNTHVGSVQIDNAVSDSRQRTLSDFLSEHVNFQVYGNFEVVIQWKIPTHGADSLRLKSRYKIFLTYEPRSPTENTWFVV